MKHPTPDEMRRATAQFIEMKQAVDALIVHVEEICGLFMDSLRGWQRLTSDLNDIVAVQVREGKTREQALRATIIHGDGTPANGTARHVSSLAERIDACSSGGFNEQALSGLCIVSIYSHWEDRARGDIARALEVEKNSVLSGLFGDLRRMRHALLHTGGRIETGTAFEVLKWFKKGDVVLLTPARFHEIVELIRKFPDGLRTPGWNPFPSAFG